MQSSSPLPLCTRWQKIIKTSSAISFHSLMQFRIILLSKFLLLILKIDLNTLIFQNFKGTYAVQTSHRVCPTTWRFDLTLQLHAFSSAEDVHLVTGLCFSQFQKMLRATDQSLDYKISLIHMMCTNLEELHTFPDICTPNSLISEWKKT